MAPAEPLVGSRWQASAGSVRTRDVTSPFDGSTVGGERILTAGASRAGVNSVHAVWS